MDEKQLRFEIARAFVDVPQPVKAVIAPHDCLECDELRTALAPYDWQHVPPDVLDACRWEMALLSADAKQHYLPAWMLRSLDDHQFAGDYRFSVLFALGSDHRWDTTLPYTDEQRQALSDFLDFQYEYREDELEAESIEKARDGLRRHLV